MTEPAQIYQDEHGALRPVRIELSESSGPVAPRYQHRVAVVLTVDGDKIHLSHDEAGEFVQGQPRRRVQRDGELPRAAYEALWGDLLAQGVLSLGGDLIGAERRQRVGVSFNFFAVRVGGPAALAEVRCDYLLSQLDDDEHAARAAVIDRLKGLWRALPPL